jgi:uracil-DNA glycosylase family 4
LDGLGTANQYAKKAREIEFRYLSLTNHGNIDGLIKFQRACKENNIKPILGCEAYIVPNLNKKEKGEKRGHVTLLIKSQQGFENLCKMLSMANLEGFYHRPRIDYDLLYDNCKGLVILSGCSESFLNHEGGIDLFYDLHKKIKDDLYLELMPHNFKKQKELNKILLDIKNETGLKTVATNDCHYIEKEHSVTQEVLLAIQSKAKWDDPNRWEFNVTGLHLKTADEMIDAFIKQDTLSDSQINKAMINTIEVAEKCAEFEIKKQSIYLPKVPGYNLNNEDEISKFLYNKCHKQLKRIEQFAPYEAYLNRLDAEFDLIETKNFIPYFMIVFDLVKWCRENEIMVGPGRGCFTGDTKVSLLNGTEMSFKELTTKYKDKKFDVYSCTKDGKIVVGKAKNPRITKKVDKICIVKLDNNEEIKCTLDHRFLMRKGKYKRADKLLVGDSLMPLYRYYNNKDGYEEYFDLMGNRRKLTQYMLFDKKRKYIVHHKNFNKLDNCPENLEQILKGEHTKIHNFERRDEIIERNKTKEHREKVSIGRKRYFKTEKGIQEKQQIKKRMTGRIVSEETCKKISASKKGKPVWNKGKKLINGKFLNHKVISIKIINKICNMYDIEVEKYHNFALSSGVFVHNSVGGSLVAYLLNITAVDPLRYDLLFSRFIAEDRNDLPDIDLDFEDSKRHFVREHLEELYGKNNIASISTFLSMKGKAAIRDVGRVFNVPLKEVDEFAKSIVYEEENSIEEACTKTEIGRVFDNKYPNVCDHAIILEGTIRGNGQHAAAVVISADDLRKGTKGNLVNRNNMIVSNWDMEDSEYMGLMKLDVLGLNTLSILNETKSLIKQNHGVEINYEKIPLDDQNVYREISVGNNVGVFQINTWVTTKMAKEVMPDSIELLSDVIALVRPGAMDAGMSDLYVKRRNGKPWKKKHPTYEKIMKSTYGVMIYQEQVMNVIHEVAGLSYSTADKIRKIIAKKQDTKLFVPFKKAFIEGCLKQKTLNKKEAEDFWEALQAHGHYSFNKSHSTEYAIIGYYCAYVKYYYPTEFICANLIHGAESKKEELIEESKRLGLTLILPKVGISDAFKWIAKDNKLYVPFVEIKGIGEKTAEECTKIKTKQQKQKGFFETKDTNSSPEKKTKIEKILYTIGAYGNEPEDNVSDYFSFSISNVKPPKKYHGSIMQRSIQPNERILSCEKCELCTECSAPVLPSPGIFNIMICGEAPGKDEDDRGVGFVGRSGRDILWPAIKQYGFTRNDFHITNVCKCYPGNIKTPTQEHITKCKKWIDAEIKYLKPAIILAFGNTSLRAFKHKESGIIDLSGKIEWNETYQTHFCWCIHPSSVLHNPSNKILFNDSIKNFIDKIKELGGI